MYDINSSGGLGNQFNSASRRGNSYNGADNSHNDIMRVWEGGGGGGPAPEAVASTPDVTSISDKNFHLPSVGAKSSSSVQSAGAQTVDTNAIKRDVNAVREDYKAEDQKIKNTVQTAMKEEFGHEDSGQAMKQMLPGGGITKMQAVATVLDPTGMAGGIYAVIDAVRSENAKLPPAKLNAMIDTTLNRLRQASEAHEHGDMNQAQQLVPDGLNFDNINWSELKEFLERNPDNDPIMQEAEKIDIAVQEIEKENSIVRGHDHSSGDLVEKRNMAVDQGNMAAVRQFTDSEIEADAAMAGASAAEIEYQVATLSDLSGIRTSGASLTSAWSGADPNSPDAAQTIEYDTSKMLGMTTGTAA